MSLRDLIPTETCATWSEEDWIDSDGFPTPKEKRLVRLVEELEDHLQGLGWDAVSAAALEGKADPRVAELEAEVKTLRTLVACGLAEVDRLRGAATQAANIAYNMAGVNMTDESRRRIVAILDPAISRAKSAFSQPEGEK